MLQCTLPSPSDGMLGHSKAQHLEQKIKNFVWENTIGKGMNMDVQISSVRC